MNNLIEALAIFKKVEKAALVCFDGELVVDGVKKEDFTKEERSNLEQLGFHWSQTDGVFVSFDFV